MTGKSAVITGAGLGIGRACGTRFAREAASLTLVDLDEAAVQGTADECRGLGAEAIVVVADISDADATNRVAEAALARFGGIDVLVNCAVHRLIKPFLEVTRAEFLHSLNVNVAGYYLMAQRVVPHMKARGGGSIVNVTSQLGFVGAPGLSAYCTAKGAQVNMTRALALELAPDGIRVNAVAPGPTDTEGFRAILRTDESLLQARLAEVPLRRLARPEEIADACLFLASEQASYITGHNLIADGGYLIH